MEKTASTDTGELALIFSNFLLQTQGVIGFRGDVLFLIENGKQQLISRANEQFRLLKKTTDAGKLPDNLEKTLGEAFNATVLMKSPDAVIGQSKCRIDAASMVFVHSLLDATIYSLCCVSYDSNPNDWLGFIKDRQLKIEDVLAKGQDAATKTISRNYIASLERESMLKKSDKLHAVCKPPSNVNYAYNYTFSRETLEKFDNLRNAIVHKLQFGAGIPDVEQMLDFGIKTGVYLSRMISEKYGLSLKITKEQYKQIFPAG